MTRLVVVSTTINNPPNLDTLLSSVPEDTKFVIAGDRKTPHISNNRVIFLYVEEQISYLSNPLGVPFDTIQRRNIAYLYAIKELNPDVILTVDDDNFPLDKFWGKCHLDMFDGVSERSVLCSNVNVLNKFIHFSCLCHEDCSNVHHRGLSFEFMEKENSVEVFDNYKCAVGVSAGLWSNDPDIGAYDRVLHPGVKASQISTHSEFISPNLYLPFNSQNTSFVKDLFPAMFLFSNVGRYDDIWQSYVCQRIMKHHNYVISLGEPFVRQDRNDHNICIDLKNEYLGLNKTDSLIKLLDDTQLYSSSVLTNMYEISDSLMKSNDTTFVDMGKSLIWWLGELK